MIPLKAQHKIYHGEFLAIVEALKTWHQYLKSFKHEIMVFMDHNNFGYFLVKKTSAPNKSAEPKSSHDTIFKLVITSTIEM